MPVGSSDFSLGHAIALDEGEVPSDGGPRIARVYHPACWEEEGALGREGSGSSSDGT
jgi:hypothetical protein